MSPGRRNAASIPLHVRASGLRLAPSERLYIRRKLGSKLSKFASSVERASVRLEDVNGPRGGVDHVCRIKVVLRALPSLAIISIGIGIMRLVRVVNLAMVSASCR